MSGPIRNALVRWNRSTSLRVAIIGLLLLPLVVGGLLVWANWNPEGNMGNVPAALVNEDQPAVVGGQTLTAGNQLAQQILSRHDMAWTTTNMSDAQKGLESGQYYLILRIPSGFSQTLTSLDTAHPKQAQVQVVTNDATNFVVDELAQESLEALQSQAARQLQLDFLDVVYSAIGKAKTDEGTAVTQAGILAVGADKAAEASRKIAAVAQQVAQGNQQIAALGQQIAATAADLPKASKAIAAQADAVATTAATVNSEGQSIDSQLADIQQQLVSQGQAALAQEVAATRAELKGTVLKQTAVIASDTKQVASQANGLATESGQIVAEAKQTATQSASMAKLSTQVATGSTNLAGALQLELAPAARDLDKALTRAAAQVPPITDAQRSEFTQVLSQPVVVDQTRQNPVDAPGDGFAPYFLSLALFAGTIVLLAVILPLNPRLLHLGRYPIKTVWHSYAPLLILGSIAATVMLLGTILLVGVRAAAYLPLLVVCLVSMACFVAIVQFLKAALGMTGTFLAVILLVLQATAAAGSYPIEALGSFFRLIHPIMPMTYSVDAFRRTIAGGPLLPYIGIDLLVLIGMTVLFLAGTLLIAQRRRVRANRLLQPELELA